MSLALPDRPTPARTETRCRSCGTVVHWSRALNTWVETVTGGTTCPVTMLDHRVWPGR